MTLDKNFGEELLHKIKDEKLLPKPRWQFLLKDYVVWGVGALALFLGAISMSLIFYMSRYADPNLYNRAGSRLWEELFLIVPFFWIICLVFFVFIMFYNIKHTKKGYRYSLPVVLAFIVGLSVILGGVFYAIGFGERIDDELGRRAPFYDRVINPHVDFWSQPERGRLTGMVVSSPNENEYVLVDRERGEWYILTSSTKQSSEQKIEIGRPIRLLGDIESEHRFKAKEILPMMPGKGFFEHLGPSSQIPRLPNISDDRRGECQQFKQTPGDFNFLLEKYPDIKTIFVNDLLKNKDQIKVLIKDDPELIKHLESLRIGTDTIIELQQ